MRLRSKFALVTLALVALFASSSVAQATGLGKLNIHLPKVKLHIPKIKLGGKHNKTSTPTTKTPTA